MITEGEPAPKLARLQPEYYDEEEEEEEEEEDDDEEEARGHHHHHLQQVGLRRKSSSSCEPDCNAADMMAATTLANWPNGAPPPPPPEVAMLDLSTHLKRKEVFNSRKQREFIPDNKKDDSYWDRRRRNNEAAKRSREKRRLNDMVLESRVFELTKENAYLRAQLVAIRDKHGIVGESLVNAENVFGGGSEHHQVALNLSKRAKLLPPLLSPGGGVQSAAALRSLVLARPPPAPASYDCWPQVKSESARSHGALLSALNGHLHDFPARSPFGAGAANDSYSPPSDSSYSPTALDFHQRQQQPVACYHHHAAPPPPPSPAPERNDDYCSNDSCCSGDEGGAPKRRHYDVAAAHLPHKLRHKSRLSECGALPAGVDDEAAASRRRKYSDDEQRISGGGEETASPLKVENSQLKMEMQRLAIEVANLKDILMNKEGGAKSDSSSRDSGFATDGEQERDADAN